MKKLLLLAATLLATAPALAHAVANAQPSTDFQQGYADRQAWEEWFNALTGQYQAGASFWASERSDPNPTPCATLGGDSTAGCLEAKRRLDPSDYHRRIAPAYKQGWNSYTTPAAAMPAPQVAATPAPVPQVAPAPIDGQSSIVPAAVTPALAATMFGAGDLHAIMVAWEANQARFQRYYVGHQFSMTTPFASVKLELLTGYSIYFDGIVCEHVQEGTPMFNRAADWTPGATRVTITGTIASTWFGSLVLDRCQFQEH